MRKTIKKRIVSKSHPKVVFLKFNDEIEGN